MNPDEEGFIMPQDRGFKTWAIRTARETPEAWLVALAVVLGTALKLWLDLTTVGTNDIAYWYRFTRYILVNGNITIYRDITIYNHPPLVGTFLWLIGRLTLHNPRLFPVFLRLPAILADIGSTIVLWKLVSRYLGQRRALLALALFALNPVLIMVSGFHGNTDPVFIFFVLLGAYLLLVRGSWAAAALSLGLAMNVKIVPVIVVPAFFFWIQGWRKRAGFLAISGLVVLAGFGYHLAVAFPYLWRNVFSYSGLIGIWGLSRLMVPPQQAVPFLQRLWYFATARYGTLALLILAAVVKSREGIRAGDQGAPRGEFWRGRYLLEAIGWSFLIFLIAAPGFGVQYLSWLIGPGIFLGVPGLFLYTLLSSIFLFRVYTFWSGGFPWHFADSEVKGQWIGFDRTLDLMLWLLLLGWAAYHLLKGLLAWLVAKEVRRRAARPPTVPRPSGAFDPKGKKIAVFVIAYNASAKIQETLDRIPPEIWAGITELFVVDDCSPDETYEEALRYKELQHKHRMTVLRNDRNQGYGGNQKIGYQYALRQGHDIVVMLHADGQYAPEALGALLQPLVDGRADMVFGSRLAKGCHPLRGGMPLYKFIGNRILTALENLLTGMQLSEFHSGYRAFSCRALASLPLGLNSDSWHFDTEILLEFQVAGLRIAEVPIPTYYGDEISHVNGLLYALNCLRTALGYRLTLWDLWRVVKFVPDSWKRFPYEVKVSDPFSSQRLAIDYASRHTRRNRLLEVGPGSGALTAEFTRLGYEVLIVESDPRYAEMAGQFAANLLCQDVETVQWDRLGSFDLVVLADVLEHLRDPKAVLQHCVDHLAPGGRVIITLPNAAHWSVRLELLLGRFPYLYRGILDQSHLRFFTLGTADAMIRSAGLRVLEHRATPIPLYLLIPACRQGGPLFFVHFLNHIFTQSWRSLLAYQWAFWCEVAPGVRPESGSGTQ